MKGQCPVQGKKCLCVVTGITLPKCEPYEIDNNVCETGGAHFIGSVHRTECKNEATVTLLLGEQKSQLKFKLHTGDQVDIIPEKWFKMLRLREACVHSTITRLISYGGMNLKVKGLCDIMCTHKDCSFYIVKTDSPAVLGLQSCIDLSLIQLIMSVSESSVFSEILDKYENVFKELGRLNDPYNITKICYASHRPLKESSSSPERQT